MCLPFLSNVIEQSSQMNRERPWSCFLSQNPRLTHDTLEAFANEQNLTISAVRNWVNNRKQRMKRGSTTSFEETPAKYPRAEDSDEGDFQARSQPEFDASSLSRVENEDIPTMVSESPFVQSRIPQTRVPSDLIEASSFNEDGSNHDTNAPTMVGETAVFKQEHEVQKQCEYDETNTNLTVDCLGGVAND